MLTTCGMFLIMRKDINAEEAVVELRNIVKALTGLDPRVGRRVEPIKPVSEEDMERFLTALFTPK